MGALPIIDRFLERIGLQALLTALMLGVIAEFAVDCSQLHNDSTSISLHGDYARADGSHPCSRRALPQHPAALARRGRTDP